MKQGLHTLGKLLVRAEKASLYIAVMILFNALPIRTAAETFYASPIGSGAACSLGAPCSLAGARNKVRVLNSSMAHDITISLRGGTYRLNHTFALGPQDSGMNGHKVIWQAYRGETPILSGAIKVSGWQLSDAGKNIYRARVPVGTMSRQLFVNGVRAYRDRSAGLPDGFPKAFSPNPIVSTNALYLSWRKPTLGNPIELVWERAWKQVRCPVASITALSNDTQAAFAMATPCYTDGAKPPKHVSRPPYDAGSSVQAVSWMENAFELLGTPGQFYLDSAAGYLYYVPREGENLATADVELPITQTLMSLAGTPVPLVPVNDNDASISYVGSWQDSTDRPNGDFNDDVHCTTNNGDSATITFTGVGINVLSETGPDEGDIEIYVDGMLDRTVSTVSDDRHPMQVVYFKTGMSQGRHTVKLVKKSGTLMVLDAYVPVTTPIAPVHDIAVKGINFTYATWLSLNDSQGYWENQAGLLWTGEPKVFRRPAAALDVERGRRIEISGGQFLHFGGTAIDLGEGTQDSSVTGNRVYDTSGTGISVGEFDDFWLTDQTLMTAGDVIDNNAISYTGQEFRDTVGMLAGYVRNTTIAHNDVGHLPYTGVSVNIGWMYFDPCYVLQEVHHAVKPGTFPCWQGTSYAQGNHITGNFVHDVMNVLHDGGAIYVNGGQGSSAAHSTISGNVIIDSHGQGIYLDQGSSWWDVSDNVVSRVANNWVDMWIEASYDISVDQNYTDTSKDDNRGYIAGVDLSHYSNKSYPDVRNGESNETGDGSTPTTTIKHTTLVTKGEWPRAARKIVAAAGLEPQYRHLAMPETDPGSNAIALRLPTP